MAVIEHGERPTFNSEVVTVDSTETPDVLTASKYLAPSATGHSNTAKYAVITVTTDAIRYTVDGTTPAAAVGHLGAANDSIILRNFDDIRRFQAVKVTNNATLQVSYS